ncbi:MAG: histidine kinase dimerization/phospho-acceptor domain-containing protein [Abditibacteriaceae bacterium]
MSLLPLRSMRARMTTGFVLFMSVVVVAGSLALVLVIQYVAKTRAASQLDVAYLSAQTILVQYSQDHPGDISLVKMMKEHQSEISGYDVVALVVDQQDHILWKSQREVIHWPQHMPNWRWKAISLKHQKLVVGIPQKVVQNEFAERSWALVALGILVIIGTALGAWWVVGRTLSPIGALARQVKQASKEDLQVRLKPPSQDVEIVELVSTFNDLLKYLGDEAIMRSRFYAIASHELRTPLQALSGHLELALSRDRDNSAYKKVMQESLGQTQRLILLVQALLQLYQIENKTQPQQVEVNLSIIIHSQLALLETWLERRALRTECNLEDLKWSAPPGHFDIVVRNLLENAVKYSCKDSAIHVDLHCHGSKVLLQISNQYDPSQNDTPSTTGIDPLHKVDSHGLGMTICEAITDANGWELEVMRENGTMTVNVWMEA